MIIETMLRRDFTNHLLKSALLMTPRLRADDAPPLALREIAAQRGLLVGSAVSFAELQRPDFANLLAQEASIVVPEADMKWTRTHPEPDRYDFSRGDALLAFAAAHDQKVRGHNLCWGNYNPGWLAGVATKQNAADLLQRHIAAVAGHFAGRIHSWDVVNEAVEVKDGRPDGLRNSIWLQLAGPGYIETAFRAAAEADPNALLTYNEYDLEQDTPEHDLKRRAVLRLLTSLRERQAPIQALGLQAHLRADLTPSGWGGMHRFLERVDQLGFEVFVTELDVNDRDFSSKTAKRDREVASLYHDFLKNVLQHRCVKTVLTWGLSDPDSWLSKSMPREDGLPQRPLPFDADLKPTPAFFAMRKAILALPIVQAPTANAAANYDEAKAGNYTLPDPLVFADGTPVRTPSDWTHRRRAEILDLFAVNMYGRSPQAPKELTYDVFDTAPSALGGKAMRKQVTVYFSPDKKGPKQDILLYVPAGSSAPVPVILALNFGGNQSVIDDPAVKPATVWNRNTHERQIAPEDSRGRSKDFAVEQILARGYAFATVCYQDAEPDFKGGSVYGIRPLFQPERNAPAPDEWGAMGAWAYGASRALDYFERDGDLDAQRVALMGHSRLGKTVLWAGALDERFRLLLSSCSGRGGAALARRNYGEPIHNLAAAFAYWFCGNFQQYADHPERLPVDSHELIALLAPRPVYITGAEEDRWGDPKGEFLACVAAGPVYQLLGARGLGTDQMPALNQPILQTIGFHYRTGKHEVTAFDWEQFLKFADERLRA